MDKAAHVLLIFVDGMGFGPRGAANPFDGAPLAILRPLAGDEAIRGVEVAAIDACLGVAGLPQSGTGQTAIFTGINASALEERHVPAFPTRRLERTIADHSVLGEARRRGRRARFLNAYDAVRAARLTAIVRGTIERPKRSPLPASALAALANGGELATFEDVSAGEAATFDFTGEVLRGYGVVAPRVTIDEAARSILAGARSVELSLFETILLDKAGHSRDITWARREIVRHERLLAALFSAHDPARDLIVVTSDHGNVEDLATRTHTRAKVPLLAFGRGAADFVRGVASIAEIAPQLLAFLPPNGAELT